MSSVRQDIMRIYPLFAYICRSVMSKAWYWVRHIITLCPTYPSRVGYSKGNLSTGLETQASGTIHRIITPSRETVAIQDKRNRNCAQQRQKIDLEVFSIAKGDKGLPHNTGHKIRTTTKRCLAILMTHGEL